MKIHKQIEIDRPCSEVYQYLLDFSSVVQWDHSVVSARKLSPGAVKPGSQFEVQLRYAGRQLQANYQLENCVENQLLELRGHCNGLDLLDRISLQADERSTAARCVLNYELQILNVPSPALVPAKLWLNRYGDKTMHWLKAALEPDTEVAPMAPREKLADRLILPGATQFTRRGYRNMPDRGLTTRMDGKTVVLTGPTSGLGLAAACELSRLGADLVLAGRASPRLDDAAQKILDFSGCESRQIRIYQADLSLLQQTEQLAQHILAHEKRLDVLINNAGALFNQRELTNEGLERSFALLLASPWLLGEQLIPRLLQNPQSRIINVVSGGLYLQGMKLDDLNYQQGRYDGSKAYARAKRGLLGVTRHWARQYAAKGLISQAMHPGWAATPGVESALPQFNRVMSAQLRDAREGADTIVWLASYEAATRLNGQFWLDRRPHISAVLPGTELKPEQQDVLLQKLKDIRRDVLSAQ